MLNLIILLFQQKCAYVAAGRRVCTTDSRAALLEKTAAIFLVKIEDLF